MWSIYLGNKEAFLNENINLIRKDIDIIVPSNTQIENVSYEIARDSILRMNESFSQSLKSASKSLLILTAPKIIDDVEETNNNEIKMSVLSKKLTLHNCEAHNESYFMDILIVIIIMEFAWNID